MLQDVYFHVEAANSVTVRTTHDYWQKIITFKHPVMRDNEDKAGRVIGFERLNVILEAEEKESLPLEVASI